MNDLIVVCAMMMVTMYNLKQDLMLAGYWTENSSAVQEINHFAALNQRIEIMKNDQ